MVPIFSPCIVFTLPASRIPHIALCHDRLAHLLASSTHLDATLFLTMSLIFPSPSLRPTPTPTPGDIESDDVVNIFVQTGSGDPVSLVSISPATHGTARQELTLNLQAHATAATRIGITAASGWRGLSEAFALDYIFIEYDACPEESTTPTCEGLSVGDTFWHPSFNNNEGKGANWRAAWYPGQYYPGSDRAGVVQVRNHGMYLSDPEGALPFVYRQVNLKGAVSAKARIKFHTVGA